MITTEKVTSAAAGHPPAPVETLLDRMVETVLELGMNGTAVTKDSLYEHSGFSRDEIERHAADACDIARQRAVTQQAA